MSDYYNDGTTIVPTYLGTINHTPPLITNTFSVSGSDMFDSVISSFQNLLTITAPGSRPGDVSGSRLTSEQAQGLLAFFIGSEMRILGTNEPNIFVPSNDANFKNLLNSWPSFIQSFNLGNIQPLNPSLELALFDGYAKSQGTTIIRSGNGSITSIEGDWSVLVNNSDGSLNHEHLNELREGFFAAGQSYFDTLNTTPPIGQGSGVRYPPAKSLANGLLNSVNPNSNEFIHLVNFFDNTNYYVTNFVNTTIQELPNNITRKSFFESQASAYNYVNWLDSGKSTAINVFLSGFANSLISNASLQVTMPNGTTQTFQNANLASYQQVYNAFNPGGDFATEIKAFSTQQYNSLGYFDPSRSFSTWVRQLLPDPVAGYSKLSASNNYAITGSTLDGNRSEDVAIINRILALLISMIGVLQKVGISQANHLTFTTSYQKSYTALQQQIPTFGAGQLGPNGQQLVISPDNKNTERNTINSTISANLADNIRSLNSLQQDSAKQQQSNINQTNDAVTNQTDMATTFLQQLNTLLNSVLK